MNQKILYMTDKFGVSQGYEPTFTRLLNQAGIHRPQVFLHNIYSQVAFPLIKKGNKKLWGFDPEKLPEVKRHFDLVISAVKPDVIVVSCPAILGVLVNGDTRIGTIEKCRGGVYHYNNIPTIVTYPITAVHTKVDERLLTGEDEENKQEPYRVPYGSWILTQDWRKVGRYLHGKQRRFPPFEYAVCRTRADFEAAKRFLDECIFVSADVETGCFPPQITVAGYAGLHKTGVIRCFVFPFYHTGKEDGCELDEETHIEAVLTLEKINASSVPKIMHNGAYDCSYFIRDRIPANNFLLDTMILWWSMYMELPKTLDFVSSIFLDSYQYWKDDIKGVKDEDQTQVGMEKYWRYCALDCYYTLLNALCMLPVLLKSKEVQTVYNDALMRMYVGLNMTLRGIKADFVRRSEHEKELTEQMETATARLRYIIGDPEFNINSPQQKVELLYNILGARPRNARGRIVNPDQPKTGTNALSSGALALKLAKTEHPLFRYVIETLESAMEPSKQISNVCNMFVRDSRFRSGFSAVGTETTRFSSRRSPFWDGGNAQNIRKSMRDWLVADEGCVLLDIDYSQSDDVFIAYESQDPEKIRVIEAGLDAHAVNAELMFKVSYEEVIRGKKAGDPRIVHPTRGIRNLTKRVGHGANFQMAPHTLFVTMGRESVVSAAQYLFQGHPQITAEEIEQWPEEKLITVCATLDKVYRSRYRRLNRNGWYAEIASELRLGHITNAFGILRRFLGNPNDNATQREATAYIGQSGTAGNINRAANELELGQMPERFRDGPNPWYREKPLRATPELGAQLLLQVHDNFVYQLDTRNPHWKETAHNILQVMTRPVLIKGKMVSVRVEAELSTRWAKDCVPWDGKNPMDLDRIVSEVRL